MNKVDKALVVLGLIGFLVLPIISMAGDISPIVLADKSRDSLSIDNTLKTQGYVRVLVQFKPPTAALSPASNARALYLKSLRSIQNQFLTRHFGSPEQAKLDREFKRGLMLFDISPLIAVTVNEQELKSLVSDPAISAISLDSGDKPHLMDSVPLIGMTGSQGGAYAMGATGEGQSVVVLDTGVQADHPFLAGKVIAEACFSNAGGNGGETTLCPNGTNRQYGAGAANPTIPKCYVDFDNICDHGTHVAGIAAGEKPTISDPPNGVAIKSMLAAAQVFTRFDKVTTLCAEPPCILSFVSDQIAALEWVYGNLDTIPGGSKIAAVNMSLGSGLYTDFCDADPRLPIIYQLKLAGVATVISSGNDSFNFAVSAPACISSAIAVGATTKGDVVTDYSNQSESLIDMLAPGGQGESPGGIASSIPVSTYTYKTGTSMAAPHVAGAFAAIRTARPDATVDEIELALKNTGVKILSRGQLFYSPRIQVNAALSELTRTGLPQTITFGPAPKLTYGGTGIVTATASSGLPVAFTTKTPATCSVSVNVVTGTGGGTCTIIASQAGNVTYLPAPRVTQSFEVAKAKQTISFSPPTDLVYRDSKVLKATATSGLPVAYQSSTPSVCTIVDTKITAVGVGSCRITASQAGNANYLAAPNVTKSFSVARATQTITFTLPAGMVYGDTAVLTATASSGLPVSFKTLTSTICKLEGSTLIAVGVGSCSITAMQDGNEYYQAAPGVNKASSIGKASQTITFNPPGSLVYGESTTLSAYASSGLPIVFASNSLGICNVGLSTVTGVGAGSCSITASQGGNENYLPAATVTQEFSIRKAEQTISFVTVPSSMVYGENASISATASSGLTVSFESLLYENCSVTPNSVTAIGVGPCLIRAKQAGNENYLPAPDVSQSINIERAPQTVTFTPVADIVYGDTIVLSASATSKLPVTFETNTPGVCSVNSFSVRGIGAGVCSITAYQPGDIHYLPSNSITQVFNVSRASQTISFAPLSNIPVGETSILTATSTSGLKVSFTTDTPGVCKIVDEKVTGIGAGLCNIMASQDGNAIYMPALAVSHSFSIYQLAQTISFPLPSNLLFGQSAILTATASSGLPILYSSNTPEICKVNNNTVSGISLGICSIIASQSGNETYLPATSVSQSFSIYLTKQTITFTPLGNLSLGGTASLLATASSGLPVNFRSNSPEVCRVDGSIVTAIGFGLCSITANQIGDDQYASATAITQTLLVAQPNYPAPGIGLNVILTGNAQGSVASDPVGILCRNWCNWSFTKGTRVRLTAIPKDGSRFAGWTGACTGKKTICTVKLGKARTVKARFK